jgi:uncharacterized NAD(P)/FAD-binding protein YdhS
MAIRSTKSRASRITVAIIGGGFSGTVLAALLLRRSHSSFRVVMVEKTSSVGRGLAYGTECRSLLLNVRARNMSAFADDPHHFLRWAQSNYDPATEPSSFLPRAVYGHYVQSVLNEAVQSQGKEQLEWIKDEAVTLSYTSDAATNIRLRSGRNLRADRVVLALGNFPARDPLSSWQSETSVRYFRNPWSDETFAGVEELNSIALLGSGLTSVDAALQLRVEGFRGAIHTLSRHGLLPQPHRLVDACPPFWNESSPKNLRGLLRLVRQQVRQAQQQGIEWQSVFDSLRPLAARIWQTLPQPERRRFLRHVRPYWEVHRHRAAPEIAQCIAGEISSGQIQVHAGRIREYEENSRETKIAYRDRNTGKLASLLVDRVINCAGPETDCRRLESPLMSSLLAQGLARPDPLFLGLDASAEGALIGHDGTISDSLYAVGPALKGSLWESTAVPELREQIHKLVQHLLKTVGQIPAAREPIDSPLSEVPSDSLISRA